MFALLPMITGRGRARHGEILAEAARLVESGRLVPLMDDRRFTRDTALEAHELMAAGKGRGKVVVDVRG